MIRLCRPDITDEDIARAVEVIRSGMLVQGEKVAAFEEGLTAFAGIPFAVAVSSGTAALHLALKALQVGPGDRVIVPAFTFPATANVVEALGAETVLCDVDVRTYAMTAEALQDCINGNRGAGLRAVMVVHEFGYPAPVAEIAAICRDEGLLLLEDGACALGTVADGNHPGFYGAAACVSFHPRKAITTGEGGAVMTRRKDLAERVASLRNHGMVRNAGGVDFTEAGLNYRITDFQAALALGQLERFPRELARRRELAALYRRELASLEGVTLPVIPDGHSLQSFMVLIDEALSRDRLIELLRNRGIETNLGAQALNCLDYYRRKYGLDEGSCPVASRLYRSGLVLPLYGALSADDVKLVSAALREELEHIRSFRNGDSSG